MKQQAICAECGEPYSIRRAAMGYKLCLVCGETHARQQRHTIAPMHKSNYVLITNRADLRGINSKYQPTTL